MGVLAIVSVLTVALPERRTRRKTGSVPALRIVDVQMRLSAPESDASARLDLDGTFVVSVASVRTMDAEGGGAHAPARPS